MPDATPAPDRVSDPAPDPPIHVDWVDPVLLGDELAGGLGLTILPGKRGASVRYPGRVYRRDAVADLGRLRELGVGFLALLVEDWELERWGDPALTDHATVAGIQVYRMPIRDGAAPPSFEAVDAVLEAITAGRASAHAVVACMGGIGRSGTIAACALVAAGLSPEDAIGHLRSIRHPCAVETAAQEAFVRAYSARAIKRGLER